MVYPLSKDKLSLGKEWTIPKQRLIGPFPAQNSDIPVVQQKESRKIFLEPAQQKESRKIFLQHLEAASKIHNNFD